MNVEDQDCIGSEDLSGPKVTSMNCFSCWNDMWIWFEVKVESQRFYFVSALLITARIWVISRNMKHGEVWHSWCHSLGPFSLHALQFKMWPPKVMYVSKSYTQRGLFHSWYMSILYIIIILTGYSWSMDSRVSVLFFLVIYLPFSLGNPRKSRYILPEAFYP